MTPEEARRKGVVGFGGIERARAQTHEKRRSFLLGTLLQDMRGAMLQAAIGRCLIGIPVAWFCVRYIESQLYESNGMSLTVLTIAALTLTVAAAAAGLIPAQRAASTIHRGL